MKVILLVMVLLFLAITVLIPSSSEIEEFLEDSSKYEMSPRESRSKDSGFDEFEVELEKELKDEG